MNTETLAGLYSQYYGPIFGYVLKRVHHPQLAEDLTQEVFVKACQAEVSFDVPQKAKSWLFRVATNTVIDLIRHQRILNFIELETLGEAYSADHTIASYPEREQVQQAISQIPPIYQQALHEWMEGTAYTPGKANKQKMRRLRAKRHFRAVYEQLEGAAS